jgi:hypothetical protein
MIAAEDLRRFISLECKAAGSIAQWARDRGLCPEQVRLFVRGKRPPEPKILNVCGLEAVTMYRRKGGQ